MIGRLLVRASEMPFENSIDEEEWYSDSELLGLYIVLMKQTTSWFKATSCAAGSLLESFLRTQR